MESDLMLFSKATNNEVYDAVHGWNYGVVETKETIEDFLKAASSFELCTKEKFGEIAGFKFVAFSKVQKNKGYTRKTLSVIDFGDVRYAIDCDLTNYI